MCAIAQLESSLARACAKNLASQRSPTLPCRYRMMLPSSLMLTSFPSSWHAQICVATTPSSNVIEANATSSTPRDRFDLAILAPESFLGGQRNEGSVALEMKDDDDEGSRAWWAAASDDAGVEFVRVDGSQYTQSRTQRLDVRRGGQHITRGAGQSQTRGCGAWHVRVMLVT